MKYQLKIIKSGTNKKGRKWVYGVLSNGTIFIQNIFNVQTEQDVLDGSTVAVKNVLIRERNGKYYFDLGL